MAPPLARPFLGALPLRPAHHAIYISRGLPSTVIRTIVTPPEAPSFLPPPLPPQSTEHTPPKRERGYLPVPRKIFRTDRVVARKMHPDYVAKTYPAAHHSPTRIPPSETKNPTHKTMVMRWKDRATSYRRENMQEGVRSLAQRRERRAKEASDRAAGRQRRAIEYIQRNAEDESDRVTRPTISAAVLDMSVKEDPLRFERAEKSRVVTEAMLERHRVSRRDALTQLYVNAKHFIVNEGELERKVLELFTETYWEDNSAATLGGDRNIWGLGMRPGLESAQRTGKYSVTGQLKGPGANRTALGLERLEKVAEELTGGKLVP